LYIFKPKFHRIKYMNCVCGAPFYYSFYPVSLTWAELVYLTSSELSVVFDSRLRVPISYATLPFLTMGQIAEESRITVFRRTHFCYWRVPSTRSEPWIQSLLVSFEGLGLREILNWTEHSRLLILRHPYLLLDSQVHANLKRKQGKEGK
jgi:hypothetical protein